MFFNAAVFGLRMEITVFFSKHFFIQKLHPVPSVSLVYIFKQMIIDYISFDFVYQIIALKRST